MLIILVLRVAVGIYQGEKERKGIQSIGHQSNVEQGGKETTDGKWRKQERKKNSIERRLWDRRQLLVRTRSTSNSDRLPPFWSHLPTFKGNDQVTQAVCNTWQGTVTSLFPSLLEKLNHKAL